MSETYIVIVLVPTRTPFSAARRSGNRCGAYCGQDNHSGAALPLLPNLYRAHLSMVVSPGVPALTLHAPQARQQVAVDQLATRGLREATGGRIGFRLTERVSVVGARLSWVQAAYLAASRRSAGGCPCSCRA